LIRLFSSANIQSLRTHDIIVTITFNNFDDLVATLTSVVNVVSDRDEVESIVINGGCSRTKDWLSHQSQAKFKAIVIVN
jgi:hypothetical protein